MDLYERETSTLNTVNRLNARISALTANNKELYTRQEIARDLLVRGENKPELILLVLGDTETADNLVAKEIDPNRVEELANDGYCMTWVKYVCMKIMAQRAAMGVPKPNTDIPAPAEDETVDDLPLGPDDYEEEDNLEFPEDESEVTEE